MGLTFEVCHVDCIRYYCCRRFHFSDRRQSQLEGCARSMGCPGSAEVRYICVANRLQRCVPAARARLPAGHAASREELFWTKTVPRDRPLRKACRMTDEQLA